MDLSINVVVLGFKPSTLFRLQHHEFTDNSGLDWYDYEARLYDAQIGISIWLVQKNDAPRVSINEQTLVI